MDQKKKKKAALLVYRKLKKKNGLLVADSSCHNLISMFKKAEINQMEITVSFNLIL
jgi:hypothetical protein